MDYIFLFFTPFCIEFGYNCLRDYLLVTHSHDQNSGYLMDFFFRSGYKNFKLHLRKPKLMKY